MTAMSRLRVNETNIANLQSGAAAPKRAGVVVGSFKNVDVVVAFAALAAGGVVPVIAPLNATDQWKIRDIILVGGGTNFSGGGGDRLLSLTDGTTTWTTIAAADLQAAPAASLPWGNAKLPFLTGTSNTPNVANTTIGFKYSGGATDYSVGGSMTFSVNLEKVA